jgi:preprotein translocase subunit SecG
MITILTVIHILVCLFLVSIVLLQHGKGADIGATFGGSSQSLFGSEGPVPMLNKVTTVAAVIFMATSIALAYLSSHQVTASVMSGYQAAPPSPPPVEQQTQRAPETVPAPAKEEPAPAEFPAKTQAPAPAPASAPAPAPTPAQK